MSHHRCGQNNFQEACGQRTVQFVVSIWLVHVHAGTLPAGAAMTAVSIPVSLAALTKTEL